MRGNHFTKDTLHARSWWGEFGQQVQTVKAAADSSIIAGGLNTVIKLDAAGNFVWGLEIPANNPSKGFVRSIEIFDSKIFVLGDALQADSKAFLRLTALDTNGKLLYSVVYTGIHRYAQSTDVLVEFTGNNILIAAMSSAPSNHRRNPQGLTQFTVTAGNKVDQLTVPVKSDISSKIRLAAPVVMKVDPEGAMIWATLMGNAKSVEVHSLATAPDRSIWLAGHEGTDTYPGQKSCLIHLTQEGTLVEARTYHDRKSAFDGLKFGPDGNLILVGHYVRLDHWTGSAGSFIMAINPGTKKPVWMRHQKRHGLPLQGPAMVLLTNGKIAVYGYLNRRPTSTMIAQFTYDGVPTSIDEIGSSSISTISWAIEAAKRGFLLTGIRWLPKADPYGFVAHLGTHDGHLCKLDRVGLSSSNFSLEIFAPGDAEPYNLTNDLITHNITQLLTASAMTLNVAQVAASNYLGPIDLTVADNLGDELPQAQPGYFWLIVERLLLFALATGFLAAYFLRGRGRAPSASPSYLPCNRAAPSLINKSPRPAQNTTHHTSLSDAGDAAKRTPYRSI